MTEYKTMKLVDILARDLKEWPPVWGNATQDCDREIRFNDSKYDFFAKELADDASDDIGGGAEVTEEEWESARYALNNKQWNGEGRPPVGTVCEFKFGNCNSWEECTVLCFGENMVFVRQVNCNGDTFETSLRLETLEFRKIRTAEQMALDEREKEVHGMLVHMRGPDRTPVDLAMALYDAGYRKQVQP